MIAITGVTGHYGKATLEHLLHKGVAPQQLRVLVRQPDRAAEWAAQGIQVVEADYNDRNVMERALEGVHKLLFVSSNDLAHRLQQHRNVVSAAQTAGVQHVVYTSFQRVNNTATSPLWGVGEAHWHTEQWLQASGLDYTILKNNLYMDFIAAFIGEHVLQTGQVVVPAQQGKISAVLRSEMAEATAQVLVSAGHKGKTYAFSNTESVSYAEMTQTLSDIAGKSIAYVSPSVEEYRQGLSQVGLPTEVIDIFAAFAQAQALGELDAPSRDLAQLLGRNPTSVHDFLRQLYTPLE